MSPVFLSFYTDLFFMVYATNNTFQRRSEERPVETTLLQACARAFLDLDWDQWRLSNGASLKNPNLTLTIRGQRSLKREIAAGATVDAVVEKLSGKARLSIVKRSLLSQFIRKIINFLLGRLEVRADSFLKETRRELLTQGTAQLADADRLMAEHSRPEILDAKRRFSLWDQLEENLASLQSMEGIDSLIEQGNELEDTGDLHVNLLGRRQACWDSLWNVRRDWAYHMEELLGEDAGLSSACAELQFELNKNSTCPEKKEDATTAWAQISARTARVCGLAKTYLDQKKQSIREELRFWIGTAQQAAPKNSLIARDMRNFLRATQQNASLAVLQDRIKSLHQKVQFNDLSFEELSGKIRADDPNAQLAAKTIYEKLKSVGLGDATPSLIDLGEKLSQAGSLEEFQECLESLEQLLRLQDALVLEDTETVEDALSQASELMNLLPKSLLKERVENYAQLRNFEKIWEEKKLEKDLLILELQQVVEASKKGILNDSAHAQEHFNGMLEYLNEQIQHFENIDLHLSGIRNGPHNESHFTDLKQKIENLRKGSIENALNSGLLDLEDALLSYFHPPVSSQRLTALRNEVNRELNALSSLESNALELSEGRNNFEELTIDLSSITEDQRSHLLSVVQGWKVRAEASSLEGKFEALERTLAEELSGNSVDIEDMADDITSLHNSGTQIRSLIDSFLQLIGLTTNDTAARAAFEELRSAAETTVIERQPPKEGNVSRIARLALEGLGLIREEES
jgi:hypothetical protein